MEETDTIIIETLRRIGCEVDETVNSLDDFPPELVIEGTVKCLKLIKPELSHLSHKMPPNLSTQYKLCMDIASECEKIFLRCHVGYETFLHGSQTDIRNVFLSLIHKLPKTNEQPVLEGTDPFQQLLNSCKSNIQKELNKPWLPGFCMPQKVTIPFFSCDSFVYHGGYSSLPNTPMTVIVPTLIEKHIAELAVEKCPLPSLTLKERPYKSHRASGTAKLVNPSRFSLVHEFNFWRESKSKKKPPLPPKPVIKKPGVKTEEANLNTADQAEKLRQGIDELDTVLCNREKTLKELKVQSDGTLGSIDSLETELSGRKKELDRMEKLYAMLENAPEHVARMEMLLATNQEKIEDIKKQWEELKQPFEEEFRELSHKHHNAVSESFRSEMEELVNSFKQVVVEIQTKQEKLQVLETSVESLPSSSLNRTFYTQRILSIVANVKKQNDEMNRLIDEIKQVQRDINVLQGKIERTFTVTDEIMFTVAKGDEAVRRIYKHLLSLHTDCSDILRLIKETGTLSREIKDLENQVETEFRKNTETKLRQTLSDLQQIRHENQILEEKIKAGGSLAHIIK